MKLFFSQKFSLFFRKTPCVDGERGQIFIMALVVSATLMAIALALSTIIMGELRISADAGYYIPAFYAADAGSEKALYCQRNGLTCTYTSVILANSASYFVDQPNANGCPSGAKFCSTGTFNGLARRIQVTY